MDGLILLWLLLVSVFLLNLLKFAWFSFPTAFPAEAVWKSCQVVGHVMG